MVPTALPRLLRLAPLLLASCARPGAARPAAQATFGDVVLSGPATTIALREAALLPDGRAAVLVCVEGQGGPLPAGGSLALIGRDGRIAARATSPAGCDSRLVRTGAELAVVSTLGERGHRMRWTRFDDRLRQLGEHEVAIAGPVTALAGREDGGLIVASIAAADASAPGVELVALDRDLVQLGRWRLRGRDLHLSQVIAEGDGLIAAGTAHGPVAIDPGLSLTPDGDAVFVLRLGPTGRWARTIGAPGVTVSNDVPPALARVPGGVVVGWSVASTGRRRPAPELEQLGGMPPTGYHTLFARLGADGAILRGRREPTGHDGGPRTLHALPGGALLEHRIRKDDAYDLRGCTDPRGCRDAGGPAAHRQLHTLVIRRRDLATLEPLGEALVRGTMILDHAQVEYAPATASLVALGTFAGAVDLPRGRKSSPRSSHRDRAGACGDQAGLERSSAHGLLALQPPEDPCRLTVVQHGALFVTQLAIP